MVFLLLTHKHFSAWRVDFILTLASYKPLIRGLRNLLDFALGSPRAPPRFLFMSSIATVTSEFGGMIGTNYRSLT